MLKGFLKTMFSSIFSKEFIQGWFIISIKVTALFIPIGLLVFLGGSENIERTRLDIFLSFLAFSFTIGFLITSIGALFYWRSIAPNFEFLFSKRTKKWCEAHQAAVINHQFVHGQLQDYDYQMRYTKNIFLKTSYSKKFSTVPKGIVINLLAKCVQVKKAHSIRN